MKKVHLLVTLFLALGMLALSVQPALAFPPLPSGFYGTVKIDGANVPAGTVVSARINGVEYDAVVVTTYEGDTVYSLDVPGDDADSSDAVEGGVAGDTIVFYVGALPAAQTAPWQSGTNIPLNLTGVAGHAPTDLSLSANTVAENAAVNTVVGTLTSTDADAGDSFTYSLVSGAGNTDNASFNISGSSLRTSAVFNFEVKSSYSVRIRTTDQGGLYYEESFTITVTDVNESPVITEGDHVSVVMTDTFDLVLHASDVDGDTLTWSVQTQAGHGTASASGVGASKAIGYVPASGYVGADSFAILVSDGKGGTDTVTVGVTINSVNNPPIITEGASVSVNMSQNGSHMPFDLTLHASDVDSDTLTWSVQTQAGHGTASASGTGTAKVIGYTPSDGYVGADSFVILVSDGVGGTDTITVNVTIEAFVFLPLIVH